MKHSFLLSIAIATALFLGFTTTTIAQNAGAIKSAAVTYTDGTTTMVGFIAYDSSYTKKRPAILIAPEWWGLNDYTRNRAKQLAALGYVAFVIDYYANGTFTTNPTDAVALATPYYKDPQLAKKRFDAALATVKTYSDVDTNKIAAIGYCFGGSMIFNAAKQGENLKGIVSFHGGFTGVPLDKDLLKAKVLACHGANDQFVKAPEVAMFKKQMDSIGADYKFIDYPGATHAFSNPDATAIGIKYSMPIAYNEAADKGSFQAMMEFFDRIFK
ncbi:MAG TPA: dienelactone hydrolase family protein [Ferruginibacter sp.]|jgi:dienelactone hydrolase|nr:dienelactone hydrolase family protein [Ferruginibacter sp.]